MLKAYYHLLIRDLRLALRSRHELANPLIFFILVVTLFPLAVTPTPEALQTMAPGVIWVSALLAVLLSLDRLFKLDYEDGSLDQLMLSPNPLMILVLAKVTAHWLLTGLPLVIIAPLLGVFMALEPESLTVLIYSLLLGTPVLSLVGATGRVTGAHLHWGLKLGGRFIDPLSYRIRPGRPVPAAHRARWRRVLAKQRKLLDTTSLRPLPLPGTLVPLLPLGGL